MTEHGLDYIRKVNTVYRDNGALRPNATDHKSCKFLIRSNVRNKLNRNIIISVQNVLLFYNQVSPSEQEFW